MAKITRLEGGLEGGGIIVGANATKAAHMPGPWICETYDPALKAEAARRGFPAALRDEIEADGRKYRRSWVCIFNGQFEVARVHWTPETDAEAKATSRLIAAAPEMLAALKLAADYIAANGQLEADGRSTAFDAVTAAIALAEGK